MQIKLGFALAAPAGARLILTYGADLAPIGHHQALAIFDHVERTRIERVHLKAVRGGEVALGFEVQPGQPLVVQDMLGRSIARQHDQLMVCGLDSGRLILALDQLAVNGCGWSFGSLG